jgi:hypothetical protein
VWNGQRIWIRAKKRHFRVAITPNAAKILKPDNKIGTRKRKDASFVIYQMAICSICGYTSNISSGISSRAVRI